MSLRFCFCFWKLTRRREDLFLSKGCISFLCTVADPCRYLRSVTLATGPKEATRSWRQTHLRASFSSMPKMAAVLTSRGSFSRGLTGTSLSTSTADVRSENETFHLTTPMLHRRVVGLFPPLCVAVAKSKPCSGWTPLHLACYFGHRDVVEELLKVISVYYSINLTTCSRPICCQQTSTVWILFAGRC